MLLGLCQRVVGRFWGGEDTAESGDVNIGGPPPSPEAATQAPIQRRFFSGVVTSVSSADSGMINDHIYFEMGVVLGGDKAEVGDIVHVQTERRHSKGGWRATRVEVTSQWNPEEASKEEVLVGFISGVGGGRGVALCEDQEVSFPTAAVGMGSGYRPHVNDWVKVVLLHQDGEVVVNDVRPLREQVVTGTILHLAHGYGTIDQDVHFTLSALPRGHQPVRGQQVRAECVEYKHHKNNWRAYRVVPVTGTGQGDKSSSIPPSAFSFPRPVVPLLPSDGKVWVCPAIDTSSADQLDLSVLECEDPPGQGSKEPAAVLRGRYQEKLAACRLPGQRPLRMGGVKLSNKLRGYPIPEELRECVEEEEEGHGDVMATEPALEQPLCMDNYRKRFSTLLYIEEIQREIDIRQFDMSQVLMRRCGPYLSLEVPGLAEGRPSLLMGDRAIICEPGGDETSLHWEGYIHEVRGSDVLLKFADSFHETFDHEEYDVMFTFNRTQFRRLHHVVELCWQVGANTLFPSKPAISPPRARPPSSWCNPALNARQRAAVIRILGAQCSPAPYVVFGPPGTGKTMTLVEAILQIYLQIRGSRLLVCAPSNSAADLLAERLCEGPLPLVPGELVRLNAIQRPPTMPRPILPHCRDTNSADSAVRARIVVATCSTAGMLHGLGLGVGHFSHVIVDEAGQATEPECLLPIAMLAQSNGQVVLAGDPCQLGPVLSSRLAGGCGLGLSLLERLMERHAYQRDEERFGDHGNYDPLLVTKLVHNYRSHCHLLKPYSELFYHGELEVCAPPSKTDLMLEWEGLPTRGFPLLFHGVEGEDMQEGNSPSWFNPVEALQVVKYVQALKDNATFAPHLSELGVVTPYRKQVEKIRQLLQKLGCGEGGGAGVKVGSVEEFQGQEKTAIIISTVRSSVDQLAVDDRHHLGFVGNAKRFNVAISRACALLVVVGNPLLLSQDPCWSKLLEYAVENGAYKGCLLPSQH